MTNRLPPPFAALMGGWPAPAQDAMTRCREIFFQVARDRNLGTLDESLKWGQPAWRPKRPRTGSTLRMGWSEETQAQLALFVDCKTDLAARMATLYHDLPANDGRRRLAIDVTGPFPEQPIAHLAEMTFAYHLTKRRSGA